MKSLKRQQDDLMEDVFLQEGRLSIAKHATQCKHLFHEKMGVPGIVPDPTIMDDQLARFTLWASNMDVHGPLNISLDHRLRFSPTVVDIIHQLLHLICETLESLKPVDESPPIASNKRQRTSEHADPGSARRADDDASDSDSDVDEVEENISQITDTIGGTISRLFRLSNAVRKSAKANRARKIEKYTDDKEANTAIEELRDYTNCYIKFKFPSTPVALREALIEANARRLRRLYYQATHRKRMDLGGQDAQTAARPVFQLPKANESAPAVRFAALPKPTTMSKAPGSVRPPPVPVTNATTARQTAVGAFYAKSTTEVPRAKSVAVNNQLSFPPMPESTQECPYCGLIVEFKTRSSQAAKFTLWQNHVISDLEPFICVFSQCLEAGQDGTGPPTFETSKAWISHMQHAHGHSWECRAPSHDPRFFDQENQYQEHMIKEHGVPEALAGTLGSAARRPNLDKVAGCPFGDEFQQPENTENTESNSIFASDALQLHVAAHIKEIALLTLQKLPSDLDETAENLESDQLASDDGPGLVRKRRSMQTILDDDSLELTYDDAEEVNNRLADREEDMSDTPVSEAESDLEDTDNSGMTKLHRAVQVGDLSLVASLIRRGASLGSRDTNRRTALHRASMDQSPHGPDLIRLLLNEAGGRAIVNLGDKDGQTALHYAAQRGSSDIIRTLVEHDADPRSTDKYGFSAFLWAVVAGQEPTTRQLLEMGADVDSFSADGKSALAWAACLGWSSIAELLARYGVANLSSQTTRISPLEEAAASGDLHTVRLLLEHDADPNYRDRDGWSAIHLAAEEGHLEIVRMLIEAGAFIDALSSYGTSPLHCAANGGHVDIVRLLIEKGADLDKSTCHGWTALHHATYMGHSDVVRCLLDYGSNASQQDNHGWSVLHLAVHSRDLAVVKILVDSSVLADPRALLDESGLTAEEWLDRGQNSRPYKATGNLAFGKSRCCRAPTGLRQAVYIGNVPMIRLLVGRLGHDVNGVDSGRRTAIYYAAKKRMLPALDLLLELGADPNILPTGRRTWEEFISDNEVLLRITRGDDGYKRPAPDREVENQIRLALGGQSRPSVQNRSVSFAPSEPTSPPLDQSASISPMHSPSMHSPSRTTSSGSGQWALPFRDRSASNMLTTHSESLEPAPAPQTNDNKRKAARVSGRSGKTSFWRRLIG